MLMFFNYHNVDNFVILTGSFCLLIIFCLTKYSFYKIVNTPLILHGCLIFKETFDMERTGAGVECRT